MATVYLARDVRHDRQVAVKVLHPELAVAASPFTMDGTDDDKLGHSIISSCCQLTSKRSSRRVVVHATHVQV